MEVLVDTIPDDDVVAENRKWLARYGLGTIVVGQIAIWMQASLRVALCLMLAATISGLVTITYSWKLRRSATPFIGYVITGSLFLTVMAAGSCIGIVLRMLK